MMAAAAARHKASVLLPHGAFAETECSATGERVRVATILLKNRRCPWRCNYCGLWKEALEYTVARGAIAAQIDAGLNSLGAPAARHLKLYNAGSFFDRAAIPPEDFPEIAERAQRFERVIVESHPALVRHGAVRFRELLGDTALEVAMGLEVADDALLARMNKRMTCASFAAAAKFLRAHGIDVRAFVMVKPPFVRGDAEAVELAVESARFAFECGASVVSLIPGRFATDALTALAATGEFSPPSLSAFEDVIESALQLERGRVFADLWDLETLGRDGTRFVERRERLAEINLQQRVLPRVST
jgi:archaeosine synthase beta-subunit